MPCLESISCFTAKMGDLIYTPEQLRADLRTGNQILLLDCRPQQDFTRSRIAGAVNVSLPSLMLRRLKKGTLNISCAIQNNEAKEKFCKWYKSHRVVLYDDFSTDANSNPSSVLSLLMKKLRQDGSRVIFLLGGFLTFQERYPEYCVKLEEPEATILGLCNLKIADDTLGSAGESSSSDSSGTPPHLSPFPVQVLPNLYLGNATNSADLEQLKKYGIRYILNVTPNVPNMFETDRSFKYMQIPINDHWSQNLAIFFPEAIAFIEEAMANGSGVLVHCLAGVSRSVTVTVAYLMQKNNMCLNEAYDYVKRCKPNISPNFNFMGQLLDFERTLGQSSSEDELTRCSSLGTDNAPGCQAMLMSTAAETSPSNYTLEVRPA